MQKILEILQRFKKPSNKTVMYVVTFLIIVLMTATGNIELLFEAVTQNS